MTRLQELRAAAHARIAAMPDYPDNPEEAAERAAVTEAMMSLQATTQAWGGAEVTASFPVGWTGPPP